MTHLSAEELWALRETGASHGHLRDCESCRTRMTQLDAFGDLFAEMAERDVDELSARRLERRTHLALRARPQPTRTNLSPSQFLALAGALLILAVAPSLWWAGPDSEVSRPTARRNTRASHDPAARFDPAGNSEQGQLEPMEETVPSSVPDWEGRAQMILRAASRPEAAQPVPNRRLRPVADLAHRTPPPEVQDSPDPHRSQGTTPGANDRKAGAPERNDTPSQDGQAAGRVSSSFGETRVARIQRVDPYLTALREAEAAYLERKEVDAALAAIDRARVHAAGLAQELELDRLACHALVGGRRFDAALTVCARLTRHPSPEQVRLAHYVLGNLHRQERNDCVEAIRHYDAAIVFGQESLYGHEARRFRAECALQTGDLDRAEADLRYLEERPALVADRRALQALRADLRRRRRN